MSSIVGLRAIRPRMPLYLGSADGHPVDPDGRQSHAERDGLTVLPTGADALVEPEAVTGARHSREGFGPVADQRRSLHRRRDPTILDQVGLAGGEDELPAGDVHLSAPEVDRVQPPG